MINKVDETNENRQEDHPRRSLEINKTAAENATFDVAHDARES